MLSSQESFSFTHAALNDIYVQSVVQRCRRRRCPRFCRADAMADATSRHRGCHHVLWLFSRSTLIRYHFLVYLPYMYLLCVTSLYVHRGMGLTRGVVTTVRSGRERGGPANS